MISLSISSLRMLSRRLVACSPSGFCGDDAVWLLKYFSTSERGILRPFTFAAAPWSLPRLGQPAIETNAMAAATVTKVEPAARSEKRRCKKFLRAKLDQVNR